MDKDEAQHLLREAAISSQQRIARDRRNAPPRIRKLLAYLEGHLFDPSLNATRLFRACDVRDNSMSTHFQRAVGFTPRCYIEDRRMETACKLLVQSELKVWQIASLLGFSDLQVFSTAFKRWAGARPARFRQRERQRHGKMTRPTRPASDTARHSAEPADTNMLLEQALSGQLKDAAAADLIQHLQSLYPDTAWTASQEATPRWRFAPRSKDDLDSTAPPISAFPSHRERSEDDDEIQAQLLTMSPSDRLEELKAESIWRVLETQSWPDQRHLILNRLRLTSPALFQLLRKKSLEVGRNDRQRGVEVATLALDSLQVLDGSRCPHDLRANLHAQGWASLGNAKRLALDLTGAESAFASAQRHLHGVQRNPVVEAEIHSFRGSLQWFQRRYEEALVSLDRALPLFESHGSRQQQIQTLMMRAIVNRLNDEPTHSIPDLLAALELVDDTTSSYLVYALYNNLALCYTTAGQHHEAQALIPKARALCRVLKDRGTHYHLRWLEGLVARGLGELEAAEEAFLDARSGFLTIERLDNLATVSLDLAEVLAQQGRMSEVLTLAAEAIPFFDASKAQSEALAALTLLRQAMAAKSISLAELDRVRSSLRQLADDPLLSFAAPELRRKMGS